MRRLPFRAVGLPLRHGMGVEGSRPSQLKRPRRVDGRVAVVYKREVRQRRWAVRKHAAAFVDVAVDDETRLDLFDALQEVRTAGKLEAAPSRHGVTVAARRPV